MEQWKQVIGYEGLYEVSDQGRVRSADRVIKHPRAGTVMRKSQIMSLTPSGQSGHLTVKLSKDGKAQTKWVHRLVAIAWVGPPLTGCEVSHKDEVSTNNVVSNLCWKTRKEHHRIEFSYRVIRSDGAEFNGCTEAAEATGCDRSTIGKVCRGRNKTAGGYGWKYA